MSFYLKHLETSNYLPLNFLVKLISGGCEILVYVLAAVVAIGGCRSLFKNASRYGRKAMGHSTLRGWGIPSFCLRPLALSACVAEGAIFDTPRILLHDVHVNLHMILSVSQTIELDRFAALSSALRPTCRISVTCYDEGLFLETLT